MCPQIACLSGCKVTQATFVWLCFTEFFQMFHQAVCLKGRTFTLHLFYFSLLCIIKHLLKLLALEDIKSHWLHLFDSSLLCFSKYSLKWPSQKNIKSQGLHWFDFDSALYFQISLQTTCLRKCHVSCNYLSFLHCAFGNISSNGLPERLHSHTDCIC